MMRAQRIINLLMVIILCLGSLGSLSAAPGKAAQGETPNEQFVIAKVYYLTRTNLDSLSGRLDVWSVNQAEGYLVAMLTELEAQLLIRKGYRVEIDQAMTDKIHQPLVPLLGQGTDTIPGYPCYRTVEETYTDLQELAAEYPDLTELIDIGDSWEKDQNQDNGYDIWAMRITNENIPGPKPTFFVMAEIHAREYVTAEAATRLIEYLLGSYNSNADIHWLLDYYEIHVVPMTNPDGRKFAESGQSWRKNTDDDDGCTSSYGTDLNRNYGFHWDGPGSSTYPCDETYRGPAENSEPETQAIENYVLTLFDDQRGPLDDDPAPITATGSIVTLHSAAGLVLWPWGWTGDNAPNHTQLQTLGRKYAYFNSYDPYQSNGLYPTNGTTDDWTYGTLGVASYTFEMGTDFFQDCDTFQNTIYPTNRNSLLYGFKASRQPYIDPKGPESLYLSALPDNIHPGQTVNLTATANDERYGGSGEPTQNIAAARYSIDQPSWITGTVTYPMEASDGSFNAKSEGIKATIDTSGLHAGRHILFVESQDADGNWGVPTATFLTVASEMTPDNAEDVGFPGQVITYTMAYTNGLSTAKDFKVSVTHDWEVSAPSSLGTLGSMESATFDVAVTVPISATGGMSDTAIVKVTQVGNNNIYDTSTLLSTAIASDYGLTVSAEADSLVANAPGIPVTYTLHLTNTGNLTDTFDLVVTSTWTVDSSTPIGPLASGESATIYIVVHVPPEATSGDTNIATLRFSSQGNPLVFQQMDLTTQLMWYNLFLPVTVKQ